MCTVMKKFGNACQPLWHYIYTGPTGLGLIFDQQVSGRDRRGKLLEDTVFILLYRVGALRFGKGNWGFNSIFNLGSEFCWYQLLATNITQYYQYYSMLPILPILHNIT